MCGVSLFRAARNQHAGAGGHSLALAGSSESNVYGVIILVVMSEPQFKKLLFLSLCRILYVMKSLRRTSRLVSHLVRVAVGVFVHCFWLCNVAVFCVIVCFWLPSTGESNLTLCVLQFHACS